MKFEKYQALIVCFSIISMIALSQSWDQPVIIYTGGHNTTPDFVIDHNNVIHCVWEHKIGVNYTKIYYSKSTDLGKTWSDAEDISLNTSLWVSDPHIISDTDNNLFVSYDFNAGSPNNMLVLVKKFEGIQWSEPDTISFDIIHLNSPWQLAIRLHYQK